MITLFQRTQPLLLDGTFFTYYLASVPHLYVSQQETETGQVGQGPPHFSGFSRGTELLERIFLYEKETS